MVEASHVSAELGQRQGDRHAHGMFYDVTNIVIGSCKLRFDVFRRRRLVLRQSGSG